MTDHGGWVTTEEWLLLATLFTSPRPRGMYDVVTVVNPLPAGACPRPKWFCRQQHLRAVFLRLYRRGLVREAVAATDVYELTPGGRQAVVAAADLWTAAQDGCGLRPYIAAGTPQSG